MVFSGSYDTADVQFLLKPIEIDSIDIVEKERLIQSGARHYSEMLSRESPPTPEYLEFFDEAFKCNRRRLANDIITLARQLAASRVRTIVLVSLARAGTPVGVLLRRALERFGRNAVHYSISIIRDRGLDMVAMDYILARHADEEIVFIDGWTGKGAIAKELASAVARYNESRGVHLAGSLYVVADIAGYAEFAASSDDYLIPCALLNATVSGLISRTILNASFVGRDDFHACVYYRDLAASDRSRWFVEESMRDIDAAINENETVDDSSKAPHASAREALRRIAADFVAESCRRYALRDANRVKVGIGETTRALLRRVPNRILIRDLADGDIRHLSWLASCRRVSVELAPWMPYRAAAIINSLGND